MNPIRVVILSRYPSGRAGLRAMLTGASPGSRFPLSTGIDPNADASQIVVTAEASLILDPGELAAMLSDAHPNVLVMDLAERWETSVDIGPRFAELLELAVQHCAGVILLADETPPSALELLSAQEGLGWAALVRDIDETELIAAVQAVHAGLIVLSPQIAAALRSAAVEPDDAPMPYESDESPSDTLTTREREVLQLLARGLPNKQIGQRLGISLHTVKFHVAQIFARLGASTRAEAVAIGIRQGDVTA